jgi:nucleoside-diphosphate-sugar epimerase
VHKDVFNVGYQNMSIMDIAHLVSKVVSEEFSRNGDIEIVTTPSDDNRSYHINSDKIFRTLGFKPRYSIEDAIRSLCQAFKNGQIPDSMTNDWYYNIRTMKKLAVK